MEIDNFSAVSSTSITPQTSDDVSMTMLRKSLDNQADAADDILDSIPPSPNPNIGSIINTKA